MLRPLIALAMLAPPAHAGSVQCECPSVLATGTGDTSCSATETGNACTVDFNTFNERDEERAFDLLRSLTSRRVTRLRSGRDFEGSLGRGDVRRLADRVDTDDIVDTLMVYVLVSNVQAPGADEFLPELVELHDWMRENDRTIVSTFSGRGSRDVVGAEFGSLTAVVTQGCVEMRGRGYWTMFKAFWSPSAGAPRCGPLG